MSGGSTNKCSVMAEVLRRRMWETLLALLLFSSIAIAQGTVLGQFFTRRESLDNQKAEEIPSYILHTDSLLACPILCSKADTCAAVTHHVGQCYLYNSSLTISGLPAPGASRVISDVAAPGARTFIKIGPCPVSQGFTSVPFADLCFKYQEDIMNWTANQERCESDGGRLIILNTMEKRDYIVATLGNKRIYPHIGLLKVGNAISWTDGSTYFPGQHAFSVNGCGHLYLGTISSFYCSWKRPSICEIPV